jgi:hypothetical protein
MYEKMRKLVFSLQTACLFFGKQFLQVDAKKEKLVNKKHEIRVGSLKMFFLSALQERYENLFARR